MSDRGTPRLAAPATNGRSTAGDGDAVGSGRPVGSGRAVGGGGPVGGGRAVGSGRAAPASNGRAARGAGLNGTVNGRVSGSAGSAPAKPDTERPAGKVKVAGQVRAAEKAKVAKAAGTVKAAGRQGAVRLAAGKPAVTPRAAAAGPPHRDIWDERVAGALAFLRRRLTGDYPVDEFGFDPQLTAALAHPVLRLLYRHYFRVDAIGADRVPVQGPALVVANHSGTLPMDALMLSMAVHDETPERRNLRLLAADLTFRVPLLSELGRKMGATMACNPDAERLLRRGELVGVFPEGFKGIGKRYGDRYKLQRFGRGGFVSAALRTGTPIVPVAIVGAEEIYPIIADIKPLARILGVPYFPVTPIWPLLGPLGLVPLPSKWLIEFGEPIPTADIDGDPEDPIIVFHLADQVRETIQQALHRLLERRPDPFS